MTRKDFLKAGLAMAVVIPGVMLTKGCSSPTSPSTDSQVFTSSSDQGHTHTVTIQKTDIENPPGSGISTQTSNNSGHSHTVTMTQADLQTVKGGTPVTVVTSDSGGHTHTFTISKWY